MRIALGQMNAHLGNFEANAGKILDLARKAREKNCQLAVFPELALFGYSPNDLLEREDVVKAQTKTLKDLERQKPKGIDLLFGAVTPAKGVGKLYYNSAVLTGSRRSSVHKTLLPTYDVFDETRFFRSGDMKEKILNIKGWRVLVLICEDMWAWERKEYGNPIQKISKSKVDLVISMNASPFAVGKRERRLKMAQKTAKHFGCPVVYVNMVGAQDELIYDGGSFAVDGKGKVLAQSAYFSEDLNIIDLEKLVGGQREIPANEGAYLHGSLVTGIRDFAAKTGLRRAHLGLSGGIDSAVALALAADALGPQNVTAIAMPGPFSAPASLELAEKLALNIGCQFKVIDINAPYKQMLTSFEETFGAQEFGVLHENVQARLRGQFLMMFSNLQNSLLLATGNKSELSVGYATLYGDMCGGLMPLGDLVKNQVYAVAKHYNQQYELIPAGIIDRAPSAELRPNQKDQDSLPEYGVLDAAVKRVVEKMSSPKNDTEKWLLNKMAASEFKRWQAPPILRVSEHAFGRGRRFPIANASYKG